MVDIEKLKALAEKAESGAWYGAGDLLYHDTRGGDSHGLHHDEGGFIAAANPAAVLELITDLQDFKRGAEVEAKLGDEARAEVKQLRAEVEALRKDAERYRWLLSELGSSVSQIVLATPIFSDDDIDAAIDECIAAGSTDG